MIRKSLRNFFAPAKLLEL